MPIFFGQLYMRLLILSLHTFYFYLLRGVVVELISNFIDEGHDIYLVRAFHPFFDSVTLGAGGGGFGTLYPFSILFSLILNFLTYWLSCLSVAFSVQSYLVFHIVLLSFRPLDSFLQK